VTVPAGADTAVTATSTAPVAVAWVDAREALIATLDARGTHVERVGSDVPPRHRGGPHIRHDPVGRHGGGLDQRAAERARLAHLRRFLGRVTARLPVDADLLLLGSGPVHEQLGRRVAAADARRRRPRHVRTEPAARPTLPQLAARLRHESGRELPRTGIGARARPVGVAGPDDRRTS